MYLDDGNSIEQASTSEIVFSYDNGAFEMKGSFGYDAGVSINNITLLGASSQQTAQGPISQRRRISISLVARGRSFRVRRGV